MSFSSSVTPETRSSSTLISSGENDRPPGAGGQREQEEPPPHAELAEVVGVAAVAPQAAVQHPAAAGRASAVKAASCASAMVSTGDAPPARARPPAGPSSCSGAGAMMAAYSGAETTNASTRLQAEDEVEALPGEAGLVARADRLVAVILRRIPVAHARGASARRSAQSATSASTSSARTVGLGATREYAQRRHQQEQRPEDVHQPDVAARGGTRPRPAGRAPASRAGREPAASRASWRGKSVEALRRCAAAAASARPSRSAISSSAGAACTQCSAPSARAGRSRPAGRRRGQHGGQQVARAQRAQRHVQRGRKRRPQRDHPDGHDAAQQQHADRCAPSRWPRAAIRRRRRSQRGEHDQCSSRRGAGARDRCQAPPRRSHGQPIHGRCAAAPSTQANHAHWYSTTLTTRRRFLHGSRALEQVVADPPFLAVAVAEQLGAGHEEDAPALQPHGGVAPRRRSRRARAAPPRARASRLASQALAVFS